jgi:hypothetical protein
MQHADCKGTAGRPAIAGAAIAPRRPSRCGNRHGFISSLRYRPINPYAVRSSSFPLESPPDTDRVPSVSPSPSGLPWAPLGEPVASVDGGFIIMAWVAPLVTLPMVLMTSPQRTNITMRAND